jgi:hypothetical protein
MTDSTTPNGDTPDPEEVGISTESQTTTDTEQADTGRGDTEANLDRSANSKPGGDTPASDQPAAPGNSEPLTDSTDGGLDGGDPGVEE